VVENDELRGPPPVLPEALLDVVAKSGEAEFYEHPPFANLTKEGPQPKMVTPFVVELGLELTMKRPCPLRRARCGRTNRLRTRNGRGENRHGALQTAKDTVSDVPASVGR
jgi:hypothetical protein